MLQTVYPIIFLNEVYAIIWHHHFYSRSTELSTNFSILICSAWLICFYSAEYEYWYCPNFLGTKRLCCCCSTVLPKISEYPFIYANLPIASLFLPSIVSQLSLLKFFSVRWSPSICSQGSIQCLWTCCTLRFIGDLIVGTPFAFSQAIWSMIHKCDLWTRCNIGLLICFQTSNIINVVSELGAEEACSFA